MSDELTPIVMNGSGRPLNALSSYRWDRSRIEAWVRDKADASHGSYQCVCFTLEHDTPTGPQVLSPALVPKKAKGPERDRYLEKLLDDFEVLAHAEAARATSEQVFKIGAHLTDKPDDHAEFMTSFTVPAPERALGLDRGHEDSIAAILGHIQRGAEDDREQLAKNLQLCMDRLLDDNRDLRRHTEELYKLRAEARIEREQLLDQQELRRAAADEKRLSIEVQTKIAEGLFMIGGAVFKKWWETENPGKPVSAAFSPSSTTTFSATSEPKVLVTEVPEEDALLRLSKTFTPAQLVVLIGMMTDEQKKLSIPDALADLAKSASPERLVDLIDLMTDEQKKTAIPAVGRLAKSMPVEQQQEMGRIMAERMAKRAEENK
jgi:hypothetical protein